MNEEMKRPSHHSLLNQRFVLFNERMKGSNWMRELKKDSKDRSDM